MTSYSNRTGAVLWSRPTGRAAQAWKVSGNDLYLTVSAGGYLSNGPVRALRKIFLRSGVQRLVRPPGRSFRGVLSRVFDGVVVFTDARGTIAYSATTGRRLWRRLGAVPGNADTPGGLLYLTDGSSLAGVEPETGRTQVRVSGGSTTGTSGFYAVRDGVVLGLDQGAQGDAWGYDVAVGRVLWTNSELPWPHYFVDLSGDRRQHRPDVRRDPAGGLRPGRGGGARRCWPRLRPAGAGRPELVNYRSQPPGCPSGPWPNVSSVPSCNS